MQGFPIVYIVIRPYSEKIYPDSSCLDSFFLHSVPIRSLSKIFCICLARSTHLMWTRELRFIIRTTMTNLINEQAVLVCVVNFIKWKLHFLENHSLRSSRLKLTKSRTGLDLEGRIHMDMATNIVMVSTVTRHGCFRQVPAYLCFSQIPVQFPSGSLRSIVTPGPPTDL